MQLLQELIVKQIKLIVVVVVVVGNQSVRRVYMPGSRAQLIAMVNAGQFSAQRFHSHFSNY